MTSSLLFHMLRFAGLGGGGGGLSGRGASSTASPHAHHHLLHLDGVYLRSEGRGKGAGGLAAWSSMVFGVFRRVFRSVLVVLENQRAGKGSSKAVN